MAWTILAGRIQPVCLIDEDGHIADVSAAGGLQVGEVVVSSMPVNTLVTGTIMALGETVTIQPLPNGCATVAVQIANMAVGCQLNFEATVNGTDWQPVEASNGTQTVNATAYNDIYILPGAGYVGTRVRAALWGGGTANITFLASIGMSAAILTGALPAGTNLIGTIGLNAYRSSDATYQPARLDKATNTIQTIDYSHHEIHAGSHFFVTDYQTIGAAATVDWLITVPNTTSWPHLTFEVQGTAITTVTLFEGADRTGSTALTVQNNDRNSITASGMTVHRGTAGGTTDGTAIWQSSGGAAAGSFRGGADNRSETEIILKQATKYVMRITSGTASNICALKLRWYDHTNIA